MKKTFATLCFVLAAGWVAADVICSGSGASVRIDTRTEPIVADSIDIAYDASWIGGNASATAVIRDNGVEVRRTTGAGEFTHTPTGAGRHELTYTTLVDGVAQDEVYSTVMYKGWKYEVVDGVAVITATSLKTGAVSVPPEIDGHPVMGIGETAFAGCAGLTSLAIPQSVTNIGNNAFIGCDSLSALCLPIRFERAISTLGLNAGCTVVFGRYHPSVMEGKELAWPYYGISEWYETDDGDRTVLRSGEIAAGEVSFVETTLVGPGTLTFDWRISANRGDNCRLYIDGDAQVSITRSTSWATASVPIPAGQHVARWSYERGSSAAANEDAAFLDNVDWRPDVLLAVTSEHGVPIPAAGTNTYSYGDSVAASVTEPEAANGTRHLCTGWTGTGSVPASGPSNAVSFVMREDSSLAWNWRTEHFVEVSVTGGTCDFAPQWVADGSTVSVSIVPATHLYSIALSGDTAGATLDGTTLTFTADGPKSIAVEVSEVKLSLTVASAHGVPSPANGVHQISWGTEVVASVTEPEAANGTQYVSTGWTGTGSVPANGTGTNVTFIIETESTLTWLWETNVWTECLVSGDASATPIAEWRGKGSEALVIPFAVEGAFFGWSLDGDADGVTVDEFGKSITIPADCPRQIEARFVSVETAVGTAGKPLTWNYAAAEWRPAFEATAPGGSCLRSGATAANASSAISTTVSGNGLLTFEWRISAGRGDTCKFYVDGMEQDSITRSTGWTTVAVNLGTGNHTLEWIYSRGSGSATGDDAAFLDNVDWRPEYSLSVASGFDTPTPGVGIYTYSYGDEVAASVIEPAIVDGTHHVCTGWTGTGSVPASGPSNAVSFVMREDSSLTWNWRTEHFVEVSVTGGTCDFAPQWVADGSTVSVSIVPATHLYSIALSGDTAGVALDGTSLSFTADGPKNIAVTVSEVKLPLTIESACGVPSPTNGVHQISWGTAVEASVAEPAAADGVQYVCTGWTGTGSVPSTGSTNAVGFTMEEASSLKWNWRTNVWITLSLTGPVYANFTGEWVEKDGSMAVEYDLLAPHVALSVTGDADGVTLDTENKTLSIPTDRPRAITLAAVENTLPNALDAPRIAWATDGADTWFPQTAVSADGVDAAQSGAIIGDEVSGLEATLTGPGTFSWSWRIDSSGNSGVDVLLDGEWLDAYVPDQGWSRETLEIAGDDEHIVRFEYWNAGMGDDILDRAWIDQVSWTGTVASGDIVVDGVSIPSQWLDDKAAAFVAAADGNYEAAARAMASNGVNKVWECYVAGLDPTNSLSYFIAEIDLVDGSPVIRWSPDLRPERVYVVEGKTLLSDDSWSVTNSASRFFRVRAFLPGGESGGGESGEGGSGGPSAASVTVTLDARGGTVSPATLTYAAPGALGALPVPQRLCWDFLGWYTGIESGLRLADTSPVPNADATFYARWRGAQYIIHYDANGGKGTMADQYADLDASVTLSANCFTNRNLFFGGWATATNGVALYDDGATTSSLTDNVGETVSLYATWSEKFPGLAVRYYDIATSGYSTWTQSESAMMNYFADKTPTIVTNTSNWGACLDSGFQDWADANNHLREISGRWDELVPTNRYHGVYSSSSKNYFAMLFTGELQVDESGTYQFAAGADDLIALYIDGAFVCGGSLSSLPKNSIVLDSGSHRISIATYEESGQQGMVVAWKKPGDTSYTPIPQSALWHRTENNTLVFHANGGTGTMADISVDSTFGANLPTCTFTKEGLYFVGWATSENGAVAYNDGAHISSGIPDLWAVWTANPRYLVIDFSAGSGETAVYPVTALNSEPNGGWGLEYKTDKLVLRRIEPGVFSMGSPSNEIGRNSDETLHEVTIGSQFYIGVFEVTQKQWQNVMGTNPSQYAGDARPVERISYDNIRGSTAGASFPLSNDVSTDSFLGRLRTRTGGFTWDLPTEAQWEYACRAGTSTALNSGKNLSSRTSDGNMAAVGRYHYNASDGKGGYSGKHTTVGSYLPNAWGLYDMHGNVLEWCIDWYQADLGTASVTDPVGPNSGTTRLRRGGGSANEAAICRSAYRNGGAPPSSSNDFNTGMRLALWQSVNTSTLHFHPNGGTGEMADIAVDVNNGVNLPTCTFTKEGQSFAGWATSENGAVAYNDGAHISPGISDLWAVWSPILMYCVIDLSAGPSAASYSVTNLASPPSGGFNTDEYKTTKLVLRRVEPGTFQMCGQYTTTLTEPYYIGMFEVTQKQYELVMGSNPSQYTGDKRPVETVSYNMIRGTNLGAQWPSSSSVDANSFMGKLQSRTGLDFDLPTEAQWEYACRAGTTSDYNNGGNTENDLKMLGRYSGDKSDGKGGYTDAHTTVGSYQPNAWGLHDMHGNVWEWCLDWYGSNLSGGTNPKGSSSGSDRVPRGGSWYLDNSPCSSSYRGNISPSHLYGDFGFRLATTLTPVPSSGNVPELVDFSDLVASYSFAGSTSDTSGNGHNLQNNGGTFCADRFGNANGAISFDGQGHNTTGGTEVQHTFTVACWYQTSVTKGSHGSGGTAWNPGNYLLFPKQGESNAGVGVKVGTDGIDIVEHGSMYLPTQLSYSATIETGWNHLCVVVENDTVVKLYLNGERVSAGTLSTRTKYFHFELGGGAWGYYTGKVDDLFLFDRALSDSEVESIYRLGL